MGLRCPKEPRWKGDLTGCGTPVKGDPDDEGLFDCPVCGLFFTAEAAEKEEEQSDAS